MIHKVFMKRKWNSSLFLNQIFPLHTLKIPDKARTLDMSKVIKMSLKINFFISEHIVELNKVQYSFIITGRS